MSILDIGCGPGTITTSLGDLVGFSGRVIGLDASAKVIEQASKTSNSEHGNVTFQAGDAANLRFQDSSFDVVHAHQVLQHVSDPVAVLREMRRVVKKPGGIISLREGDLPGSVIHPNPGNTYAIFTDIYDKTARASGADPQLGRKLYAYLRYAGFNNEEIKLEIAASSYGANKSEEAEWWGNSWADRCLQSGFHDSAIMGGHATEKTLQELSTMWREWGKSEDALWAIFQSQGICVISD